MRPLARLAALALAPLAVAACEFDEKTIGNGKELVAVHGVLNPGRLFQTVLVERTLTGRSRVDEDGAVDVRDPIATGRGVPVSGAVVTVYGPAGDSAVAIEERTLRSDGTGAGVYRFYNLPFTGEPPAGEYWRLEINGGATYRLRVETPDDEVVTGSTTVPQAIPASPNLAAKAFNRDRDSVFIFWSEVPSAHRYAVRFDAPRGPMQLFVDSLEYLVSGKLRNFYEESVPSVFIPGFEQDVSVGAVDEHYYDYYRSQSDQFTGSGLINHLQGGIGVFGSYVLLRTTRLRVTADEDLPIEGSYQRAGGGGNGIPPVLQVWIEGRYGQVRQLSGYYLTESSERRGVIGTLGSDDRVTLALLGGQSVGDTVLTLEGRFDVRTISGWVRGQTARRFDFHKAIPPLARRR
jgi:hypothetical protein